MIDRPRIADLFCGAGGAGMGLHRAGYEVVGFDIKRQPHYPFEFHQQDAFDVDLSGFDAVWASPSCQRYIKGIQAVNKLLGRAKEHPDLVGPTRELLQRARKPWVIENVQGAPLREPFMLCGSSFGLRVQRHRLFEGLSVLLVPACQHSTMAVDVEYDRRDRGKVYRRRAQPVYSHGRFNGSRLSVKQGRIAMGIDWMNWYELTQAIPPAYSEWIGRRMLESG